MNYTYTGSGQFLVGLPARDLDDSELNDEQAGLLELGLQLGLYEKGAKKADESNRSRVVNRKGVESKGTETE